MKRATIYLDPGLHRALKLRAAESDETISALVNRAVQSSLAEDLEDIDGLGEREGGRTESYESFLAGLRADGVL